MLITCPYCGPRDVIEFTYQGDGNRERPQPASQDLNAWNAYVYDRLNPVGAKVPETNRLSAYLGKSNPG